MLISILVLVVIAWFITGPIAYRTGRMRGIEAAAPLAIAPPVEHECVWDNWGEPYKETVTRNRIGWGIAYQEYQDRLCLGCGIKEVRQINPSYHY